MPDATVATEHITESSQQILHPTPIRQSSLLLAEVHTFRRRRSVAQNQAGDFEVLLSRLTAFDERSRLFGGFTAEHLDLIGELLVELLQHLTQLYETTLDTTIYLSPLWELLTRKRARSASQTPTDSIEGYANKPNTSSSSYPPGGAAQAISKGSSFGAGPSRGSWRRIWINISGCAISSPSASSGRRYGTNLGEQQPVLDETLPSRTIVQFLAHSAERPSLLWRRSTPWPSAWEQVSSLIVPPDPVIRSPVKWEDTGIMTPDSFEEGGVEGGYEVSTKRRGGSQGYVSRYLARPSINHDQAFRYQPSYGGHDRAGPCGGGFKYIRAKVLAEIDAFPRQFMTYNTSAEGKAVSEMPAVADLGIRDRKSLTFTV
ncbi:hypothetical protein EHS25_001828 [Saitozyma podzolica]|uniref:Uncharacterized protein n=1 Tax=Saitozyma podzolica TaxID=1890683 RepID=A0A427YFH0_9TREE|nr:hypothetical protein EHS25_001828 [Saitozyma podzolica]